MNKLNIYFCPVCGNVTLSYGRPHMECCGQELLPLTAVKAEDRPIVTEMDGEFLLEFGCPMTKTDYIAAVVVERFDQVALHRLFAEQAAQVRVPQVRGAKVYVVRCTNGRAQLEIND